MKKTFIQTMLVISFVTLISCHKEVKKPAGKVPESNAKSSAPSTTETTTYTGTQTQSGHTCGGNTSSNNGGHP